MSRAAEFLERSSARIDAYLDGVLPPADREPTVLHEAIRYAVFAGGKRLRPALAFGAAEALGADPDRVRPVAAAVEMVHAYSLVHDDLPAMDDDDERRGRPTVHVRFGEANAILAGDALLADAYGVLARGEASVEVIAALAHAAGSANLVGGQVDDLDVEANSLTVERVESVHERKSAALFRFAVEGAARMAGAKGAELAALDEFALAYGLAFQGTDDLLDAEEDDPTSLLRVLEPAAVRSRVVGQISQAQAALRDFGPAAGSLLSLAEDLSGRLP